MNKKQKKVFKIPLIVWGILAGISSIFSFAGEEIEWFGLLNILSAILVTIPIFIIALIVSYIWNK